MPDQKNHFELSASDDFDGFLSRIGHSLRNSRQHNVVALYSIYRDLAIKQEIKDHIIIMDGEKWDICACIIEGKTASGCHRVIVPYSLDSDIDITR